MKNKKRLIARIGAVIAVVLMVGALVVPCFAVQGDNYNPTPPAINTDAWWQFVKSRAQQEFRDEGSSFLLNNVQTDIFLEYTSLYSGVLPKTGVVEFMMDDISGYNPWFYYETYYYNPSLFYFSRNGVPVFDLTSVYYQVAYRLDIQNGTSQVLVRFFNFVTDEIMVAMEYSGLLIFGGTDGYKSSISLSSLIVYTPDPIVTSVENETYFFALSGQSHYNGFRDGLLTEFIMTDADFYSPAYWYAGYKDAYLQTWHLAYDEAYKTGYADGYLEITRDDLYQQGYNDATEQIDDGDWGRNFLGGLFEAPMKALNGFTLVEWTTEHGSVIRVTLAMVASAGIGVSLFIWFLKMFAGG